MHVGMIAEAGIGSIVYSWWGRGTGDANGDPTDEAIVEMMLDRCLEYGVTLAFHIEPYKGRNAESVAADARFIFTRTHARTHARTHERIPPSTPPSTICVSEQLP
jgi:glycoprotein endo-alpha-1,2-mannosidase